MFPIFYFASLRKHYAVYYGSRFSEPLTIFVKKGSCARKTSQAYM
jgi:hypothetical protein